MTSVGTKTQVLAAFISWGFLHFHYGASADLLGTLVRGALTQQ